MIVLDTHALIWWVNGDSKLSARARKVIESEMTVDGGKILVSAITAWEIAMLVNKNRLVLTMDLIEWLDTVRSIDAVQFVPIDNEVAVQSVQLPGDFHPDPADRMITALARHYSAMLVTSDDKIRNYRHVKTIW
jgi:PIN domain nuclease of toxin-antitoxin system